MAGGSFNVNLILEGRWESKKIGEESWMELSVDLFSDVEKVMVGSRKVRGAKKGL